MGGLSQALQLSDLNLYFKEDRQITHNSMFADFAHSGFPRRLCCLKPETKLSKIVSLSGTRQNPAFVNNLTKIGSTLSPEERQLHAWSRSACRGTHNIRKLPDSSIKICKIFAAVNHASTRMNPNSSTLGSARASRAGDRASRSRTFSHNYNLLPLILFRHALVLTYHVAF